MTKRLSLYYGTPIVVREIYESVSQFMQGDHIYSLLVRIISQDKKLAVSVELATSPFKSFILYTPTTFVYQGTIKTRLSAI
jgi:hypothetical protein